MTRDKVSQFPLRLIKLTEGGELTWESYAPINVELPNSEIIIDKVYTSILGGRKIKLYKYKYKYTISNNHYYNRWCTDCNWDLSSKYYTKLYIRCITVG